MKLPAADWRDWGLRLGLLHPADAPRPALLLLSLFIVTPAAGWAAWGAAARRYFPQVDFARPRPADALRILLQLIWLSLIKPPSPRSHHGRQTALPHLLEFGRHALAAAVERRHRVSSWLEARYPQLFDPVRQRGSVEAFAEHAWWRNAAIRAGCYLLAALLGVVLVTTPFDEYSQAVFTVVLLAMALWVRRIPGPVPTLILMVFSIAVSTRYIWWRTTSTINDDSWPNLIAGVILLGAEVYAWLVLLLGFFQSSWMLERKVVPLPADTSLWPVVDVFIPIYSEPLRVLKPTVFAAASIDWPADKLRVHILDDGTRDEIREFAAQIGVGYIVRSEHKHAKAGNINHALGLTDGSFVAIFDCDHIPARSFLQTTMGGFLKDEKLSLVQTPHHFFSADPFERNLDTRDRVPNEGELFYGRVQDGNDLWNASFFCGSCAVLRREALMSVGGIAVETVTEDAHTSLKMHRRGYRSAYINLVQAAGLATESLSAHVGQRIRWARGMAQIFRSDNPMLGKGLTLGQRFCYLNAMMHFLYGIPRLVFLTAPLAFLLFHAYTIYAPALGLVLYVVPHMVFSVMSNSRMHGAFRRSFWGEVYETVLAWYITLPTTVALFFPGLGKFNVTAKGGLVEQDHVDWNITKPYLFLLGLNLLGVGFGVYRIWTGPSDEIGTVVVNLFWVGYNTLLLGVALGVARELRQVRVSHRVQSRLPVSLHLPDGRVYPCHTIDYSEGGMALELPEGLKLRLKQNTLLTVSMRRSGRSHALSCRLVFAKGGRLSVRFVGMTLDDEMALVQCTFGRADAWLKTDERRHEGSPLGGAWDIWRMGGRSLWQLALQAASPLMVRSSRWAGFWNWLGSLLPRQPHIYRDNK
ncbi:UDP-forming cellulose synthase catalytic subunit [Chromobacterium sp. ATCC 53434]|uniref:UDP-forming cellulose synthase catalytic subunit n=1 Tax=Chromobacterium sp. (strain ATCC 53434 / SC 14030) TaxID=2059672 RepID=UPI000C767954|nr:UDP-forming cellulose synthase catalytic subunit [Chromobacterium sp. ATCC 53434]AUH50815.1 UDP-forming cellulose synthase catalytic subunit [Chromobacterium sp. ATCC 53434]